jgi:hypothetical protein
VIYFLFNDTVNNSDNAKSCGRMINESRFEKNMKESGRGLI